jgi:RNA polymerase-binding protein DksA
MKAKASREITGTQAKLHIARQWLGQYHRLSRLRDDLEAQRQENLSIMREPLERFSMDMADAASDEFDHDFALSRLCAEQNALFEIEAALKRIRDGTYGICELTGKPISPARLEALPWTRFTLKAERELEETGQGAELRKIAELRSVIPGHGIEETQTIAGEEEPTAAPANDESLGEFSIHNKEIRTTI